MKKYIYSKWYELNGTGEYVLSVEYYDMLRWGYGKLFSPLNLDTFVLPYQQINFYCINKYGYVKIFKSDIVHIDDFSLKDLMKNIERICEENNLKFVALGSLKYSWIEIQEFLGEDCKFEYDEHNNTILYS